MVIAIGNTELQPITGTLKLGGGDVEVSRKVNHEQTPVMKHALASNGEFYVEVNDKSAYSKSLDELLALHSGVGESDAEIVIDGVVKAYRALITVDMVGILGQYVKISWKGASNG